MNKNQIGFSLIELLIVVVIIFFFAATATTDIYTLSLHDALPISISALRTLHGAQMTYASTYGNGNYAGTATDTNVTDVDARQTDGGYPGLIDSELSGGNKAGYLFVGGRIASTAIAPAQFCFSAIP